MMEVRFTPGYVNAWSVMETNLELYINDKERFKADVKAKYPDTPDEDIEHAYNTALKILQKPQIST